MIDKTKELNGLLRNSQPRNLVVSNYGPFAITKIETISDGWLIKATTISVAIYTTVIQVSLIARSEVT